MERNGDSKMKICHLLSFLMVIFSVRFHVSAANFLPDSKFCDYDKGTSVDSLTLTGVTADTLSAIVNTKRLMEDSLSVTSRRKSIYELPYSVTGSEPNWKRLWTNTAVLGGAFVSTLLVLECLPEDATAWNREEIQSVPAFKRWYRNVFKRGFEWDHDKFYFNYILHPYAGAAYYMGARSCGFNAWQSLAYSAFVSTFFWELGIEAFMERPSIQDLFITPLVGSLIGEGFYKVKRKIVENGYELGGSALLGNIVVFLVDPVNEVIGLFAGNECRKMSKQRKDGGLQSTFIPTTVGGGFQMGLSLTYRF